MIFVTGATGRVGSRLIQSLLKAGQPVRGLVRDPQKAHRLRLPKSSEVVGDLENLLVWESALQGCDRLVSIPPNTFHQAAQEIRLFQAAERAGIQHIVKLSSVKAQLDSPCHFFQQHAIAEQALKQSGLPFTILQSNSFVQNFLWFRDEIQTQGTLSLPLGNSQVAPIDIKDVVAVIGVVLNGGHEGAIYNLTGPERLTMTTVTQILANVMGRTICYVDTAPAEFEQRLIQAGVPEWYAGAIAAAWQVAREGVPTVTDAVYQLTRVQPTSFAEFASFL
ncbi:MAG: SDR family oxidoreductase [Cyanobacteria bacterium J06636_16]